MREQKRMLAKQQVKDIATTYGRTKSASELAEDLKVSRQRIHQIVCLTRKQGVNIPNMRDQIYRTAVDELRKEHPELFNK